MDFEQIIWIVDRVAIVGAFLGIALLVVGCWP